MKVTEKKKGKNQSHLEESNWRLSFVCNFSQQFCQVTISPRSPPVLGGGARELDATGVFPLRKYFTKWRDLIDKIFKLSADRVADRIVDDCRL